MTDDPILAEVPTVEIAGHVYVLRRLGLKDVFRVARVLGNGVAILGDVGNNVTPGQVLQVLVASMTRNEDEVLALLAGVIGVEVKAFDDAERFPMDSIVTIMSALAEHQDLKAFLSSVQALMEKSPEMKTVSQGPSSS